MFGMSARDSAILVATCCCCIGPVTMLLLGLRFRAIGFLIPAVGIFAGLLTNAGGLLFGGGGDDDDDYEQNRRPEADPKQSLAAIRAQTDTGFNAQIQAQGAPPPGQYGAQSQPPPGRDPFMPDPSQFQPQDVSYKPGPPGQQSPGQQSPGQRSPGQQSPGLPPAGQSPGLSQFMPDASQWQGRQSPQGQPPQGQPPQGQPPGQYPQQGGAYPQANQPLQQGYNPAQGQRPPQGQQPQNPYPVRPGGQYGYRIEPGAPGPQYSAQRGGVPPQGTPGQRPQQGQPPQGVPGQRPQQGQPPQGTPGQRPQQGQPPQGVPGQRPQQGQPPPNPAQQGWQDGFPNPNISLDTAPGQPPPGAPGYSDDDYYGDAGIPGLRNSPHRPRRDSRRSEWHEGEIFGGMLDDEGDGYPDF